MGTSPGEEGVLPPARLDLRLALLAGEDILQL